MNPSTNLQPIVTGTRHENSFNVTDSFNTNYNTTYVDETPQILEWISPLEPRRHHQGVSELRLDGLGDWFLRTDDYINWRDDEDGFSMATLFCSGAPGAGKTYLTSLVIDELCKQTRDQKIAVACLYCDFRNQEMQTPENVLGALIKQIIRGLEQIPTEIAAAFQRAKRQVGGRAPRISEVLELLKAAVAPLRRAFICIDALDEFLEKHLPKLLRSLHAIAQSCPGIRFFFTGRPHIEIEIRKYFSQSVRCLQIKPARKDIVRYVEMVLDEDPIPEAMNSDLHAEIMSRVSETISDVFLLVSLNITAILGEATVYDRREQLRRMTKDGGLDDAYSVTLERIKGQIGGKSRLAMEALMWISRSERPVTPDELCHALGVQIGSTCPNPDKIPSIQTMLASCLGLVVVDREESTVRLVHFTLQEYFNSRPETFQNPYAVMAEACLTYLNFDCVRRLRPIPPKTYPMYGWPKPCSPALDDALQKYPFLEHASSFWGSYARNETTQCITALALLLLNEFDSHISSHLLLRNRDRDGSGVNAWMDVVLPKGFTGLHCVAYLGIDEIADALLETGDWDVDKAGFEGYTPLGLASMNGHQGIIRLLLEKAGANINTKDTRCGDTPLSWAINRKQEGTARLLLEREEINLESRDDDGRTLLSKAAERGREWLVKLLLEQGSVNPDSRDDDGRTPLSYAAEGGHEEVVNLLLEREEVNPESRDNYGQTPLSHAAGTAVNEAVVKLLLQRREVNPESRDNYGRTPLSLAIWCDRNFKLLLEREGVDPESRDDDGRTPLSYAVEGGHEEVVNLLLEREEVNPESRDDLGRTPLLYAVNGGNLKAAMLLLEREEVNPELRDNFGRTLLSYAAESASEEVFNLLLEREEVNPESRDNNGRTPLSYAAQSGNQEAVMLLLEQEEVNPESRDNNGRTPLSHAARALQVKEVVNLLLEREQVNPESRDNNGRTPLSHAADAKNNEPVLKLLLEREEVNPDSRDNYGRTPLSYAARGGWEEKVELLLERKEANPESRDDSGRTPLSYAAECWYHGKAKLLLEQVGVNPESRDDSGRTPLSYAAGRGSHETVMLLLEREEVNPELRDNDGRTPLSYAAGSGEHQAVKLLLEQEEVNSESRDDDGRTPLSYAAEGGREEVVHLLLEREEVNPELRDNDGRTPLSYGAGRGMYLVVKLLLEQEGVNPESRDNFGRTPLSYAAESGSEGTVKLLLEREEVNPESHDNEGRTPLSYAAGADEGEAAVKLLLEREEINSESRDNEGRTPLSCAAECGSEGAVKLLLEQREVDLEL